MDKELSEFHKSKNDALGVKPICKQCRHDNRHIDSEKRRKKYQTDSEYRIGTRKRASERRCLPKYKKWRKNYWRTCQKHNPGEKVRRALHSRLRQVLFERGVRKSMFMKNIVGCSHADLLTHLERTWSDGMSWSNYGWGDGKWVIDHIVPCAAFDLTDVEQQKKCFHHTNLRAMWWRDNARKNCLLEDGRDARKVYGYKYYKSQNSMRA